MIESVTTEPPVIREGENFKIKVKVTEYNTETAEGEELTLQNTKENGKIKFDFKGNTEQYSTTGKNKLSYTLAVLKTTNISGTWNNNVYSINGLTFEVNELNVLSSRILFLFIFWYSRFYQLKKKGTHSEMKGRITLTL